MNFLVNQTKNGARFHLIDSGASYHLISRRQLTPEERAAIAKAPKSIYLQTANGIITADEVVDIYILH